MCSTGFCMSAIHMKTLMLFLESSPKFCVRSSSLHLYRQRVPLRQHFLRGRSRRGSHGWTEHTLKSKRHR
uniref:Uncharacterized protein n=1 Tax=Chromera velia CCMP2878 TaxID=1169474 RepID=A0A0G4IDB7_9ALVE|eukprot:Cvel_13373.t1-p1 / transcript=Cvel_13373.t1 / gene=Cvel_13373 / organism=Chromera_velia_CCMP2878 / gene_product=hypothetical protein / transcript_product=hypothetical protein / location=Cvel_scaffold909:59019-60809(-) / protein_length=69 / sequence_SO=supercontig / SO=protein_coding / is_pseudo=false